MPISEQKAPRGIKKTPWAHSRKRYIPSKAEHLSQRDKKHRKKMAAKADRAIPRNTQRYQKPCHCNGSEGIRYAH